MGSSPGGQRAIDPKTGEGLYANMIARAGTAMPEGLPAGSFVPVQPITTPSAFPQVASTAPGTGSLPNPDAGRTNLAMLLRAMQGGGGPSQFGRGGSSPNYGSSGRGGSFGGRGSSARSGGLY